ncbi:MAG TPA: DUF937 domain-containing protein [Verrucomicrobiota bacterium]|nr:hypothetical protein [Verrucomicrobiales bacterium]HRI12474.1 DUF937 domain-containing protein [Verrucomicrobiota bacterium]
MGLNLVELIAGQLGGETINKLGTLIGQTPEATKSAVSAAVPGLLAGVASVASEPAGADQLFNVIGKQDQGLLGNFGGMLGSQGSYIAGQGGNVLTSLLGTNLLSGLTGALTKFTGLPEGAISKLVGALAPLVLGVLGKQVEAGGLNAAGLSGLLASQKSNIIGALPNGFGSLLGNIPNLGGLLGSAGSAVSGAAAAASGAAQAGAAQFGRAAEATAASGSGLMKYLIPLAIIVVAFLWYRSRNANQTDTPQPQPLNNPAQVAVADALGVLDRLNRVFSDATAALATVKDPASASAVIPKLQALGVNLDAIQGIWSKIPEATRPSVQAVAVAGIDKLKTSVDTALAIPGVSQQLKPVTDQLLAKLQAYK